MEPVDVANEKFNEFYKKLNPSYWNKLHSEADVRMKVIDKIFIDIL